MLASIAMLSSTSLYFAIGDKNEDPLERERKRERMVRERMMRDERLAERRRWSEGREEKSDRRGREEREEGIGKVDSVTVPG